LTALRFVTFVAAVTPAFLAVVSFSGSAFGLPPLGPGVRPEVGTRQTLELLVMALQLVGVLTLAWLKLAPGNVWAEWGLMGIQVGLGIAGAACAGFESGFALFAGATLVLLLLGATIHTEDVSSEGRQQTAVANS